MAKKITTKKFAGNVILSVSVQVVSLVVSFILSLIVPKHIDEIQYSYWQIYVLYVSYVGVLHFGLLDGIVLRYSQFDYEDLDKSKISSQFKLLATFLTVLALISILTAAIFIPNDKKWIVMFVSIGIISKNIFTYTQYSFQITNRISKYAVIVISQRLLYGILVLLFLLFKINNFIYYCLADLVADFVAIIIGMLFNKGLYFKKSYGLKNAFEELNINIRAGIILMFANLSAALLVGSAKMVIQWHWPELIFGKVSFAFSLSNIFLTFVNAVSVVLFPSLKRINQEDLPKIYPKVRESLSFILLFGIILYFPGCWIVEKWLPLYTNSLHYLGILLPIVIFTSKVSLLTNNYLKVYRLEKAMMIINVSSVIIGFILFIISAYLIDSLDVLLVFVVIVVMINSISSEIVVYKVLKIKNNADFIIEALMVIMFICATTLLSRWIGFVVYFASLIVYSIIKYKTIIEFIMKIKSIKESK